MRGSGDGSGFRRKIEWILEWSGVFRSAGVEAFRIFVLSSRIPSLRSRFVTFPYERIYSGRGRWKLAGSFILPVSVTGTVVALPIIRSTFIWKFPKIGTVLRLISLFFQLTSFTFAGKLWRDPAYRQTACSSKSSCIAGLSSVSLIGEFIFVRLCWLTFS